MTRQPSPPSNDFAHVRQWVFDLDNTLYPPAMRLFDQIERRMTEYVMETLGVAQQEADRLRHHYWSLYGTTLAGLMSEHGVEPGSYLTRVHDISFDVLSPDPALRAEIAALPGRRFVYTNGSAPYAERVLEARGLSGLFDGIYGVEHAGYLPKPQRAAFETVFGLAGVTGAEGAMFEDDPRNLLAPHEMGMQTVLVAPERLDAPHVRHHTNDLAGFLARLASGQGAEMQRESFDVMISGGGVAGLTAAAVFGALGLRTLCVDPTPPTVEEGDPAADLRTTAFLQPAIDLLTRAGLWERLAPFAAPLSIMRIVDAGGAQTIPRLTRDFDSADISDQPFGWNLPNWLLRREMVARLGEMRNVAFRTGVATAGVLTRTDAVLITLSDGAQVSARLLVAADGRNSPVREALAIPVRRISYGQKALAFAVTHPVPHGGISTEVHRSGGPFTLVPLPDREGRPASAVVWMESGPEALRLSRLPVEEFEAEATERSAEVVGPLRLITRRSLWPIISQRAERMTAERVALVAEAAHVVPPIGAQGLNMSLADIATLADLAAADPAGLGGAGMLRQFALQRERDVHLRQAGIDLLNRASMVSARPLRDLRAAALGAFYSAGPVRKTLMRAGLGAGKSRD